ncbi:methyltransferase domain-containing protein [Sphingobium nicotianae]|uniref:Methyltransferase domain-containing protein n=1 Tax=Sphingobium nicotianae TaxID=2782607 RepID=A0A9X1IQ47_9SPHN|nr:methyltransferase domain-containing protein [Sphingobium nicotianae]
MSGPSSGALASGAAAQLTARGWQPSKFALRGGRWLSAPGEVNVASRLFADRAVTNYVAAIRDFAHGALADLGCGNAPLAGVYAPYVESMLWVDWPGSLHQKVALDVSQDLNQPLAIESASLDTVLLTDVLEHIARPDDLIAELRRILRPGGRAIIGVPFLYWLHEEPHDHHRYTIHKLRDFAAAHGFAVLREQVNGGGLDVVRDLLTKLAYAERFPLPAWLVHHATGALFAPLGPVSRRAHNAMPMGYTVVWGVD